MNIKAEVVEYSYDYKDKKVLMIENYHCHAGMVTLKLEGKQINVDAQQLISAVRRCSLGVLE